MAALMLQCGLKPLEPYPGLFAPWRCECTECHREVSPIATNVIHKPERKHPCRYCAKAREAKKLMRPHDDAAAKMRERGYEPLEPYPGAQPRWRCLH
ncbi:unnamed protein product, partial [marine sediment metagenome]